jgi:hypothetical protein
MLLAALAKKVLLQPVLEEFCASRASPMDSQELALLVLQVLIQELRDDMRFVKHLMLPAEATGAVQASLLP